MHTMAQQLTSCRPVPRRPQLLPADAAQVLLTASARRRPRLITDCNVILIRHLYALTVIDVSRASLHVCDVNGLPAALLSMLPTRKLDVNKLCHVVSIAALHDVGAVTRRSMGVPQPTSLHHACCFCAGRAVAKQRACRGCA